jgi:hypothetical protein
MFGKMDSSWDASWYWMLWMRYFAGKLQKQLTPLEEMPAATAPRLREQFGLAALETRKQLFAECPPRSKRQAVLARIPSA